MQQIFNLFLLSMTLLAVVVFIVLQFVNVGYGRFYNRKWGKSVVNKIGWMIMEMPVFILMAMLWLLSDRVTDLVRIVFLLFFEIHYFHRSFIFPFRMRGKSAMAILVVVLAITFNILNAAMQGGWIFFVSPENYYTISWLWSPQFIAGTILFFSGMIINQQSDSIIRNLRKENDTNHYLPTRGMFRYVSSANYFGELVEWIGFAVLTWSWSGVVFVIWTFANLAPRAAGIHERYKRDFPEQMAETKVKRIIPFVY